MRRPRLVIMLKEPVAGRVKTRLGSDIGMTSAAWWFRHQTNRLLQDIGRDSRWETLLSIAPDRAVNSRALPANLRRMPQGSGDLGARMKRILQTAPLGPVLVIGADIPDITARHIAKAFEMLGRKELVFGPASDGGFWLVGAKRATPLPSKLFENVRWSSEYALNDTLKSITAQRVGFIDTLNDVDTISDLRQL